jgi:hypothetical protein
MRITIPVTAALLVTTFIVLTRSEQNPPAPRTGEAAAIAWAASYDAAMARMGDDLEPVILYFTYDG